MLTNPVYAHVYLVIRKYIVHAHPFVNIHEHAHIQMCTYTYTCLAIWVHVYMYFYIRPCKYLHAIHVHIKHTKEYMKICMTYVNQ